MVKREAFSCKSWRELFLNEAAAADTLDTSAALELGHSVVLIGDVATVEECETLIATAMGVGVKPHNGRVRTPVQHMFDESKQALCNAILVRVLGLVEKDFPALRTALFRQVPLARCIGNPELTFAMGEPAVNIYTVSGQFAPHEDEESLTILTTLSPRESFQGGGTAFWRAGEFVQPALRREDQDCEPAFVLKPPVGTTMLFGGKVTHAAQHVLSGQRGVFVASVTAPADLDSLYH